MGSVVVSVDAELGWGFHDLDGRTADEIEPGRTGWRRLLDLFDGYAVPATWGVVGHLFLDECDGVHADHPTPPGWFRREREAWRDRPDLRFGDGLVADLLDADVDHDVGCHTFSHVVFDADWLTRELVRAELEAAIEAGRDAGVEFDSFVFPRNVVGYRDVLAECGFAAYRGEMPGGPGWTLAKLAGMATPAGVRVVEPSVDRHGLVDVPPSLYLFGVRGRPRIVAESVWRDPIVQLTENGIDRAIDEGGIFHVWLHPNDVQTEADVRRIRSVLEVIDERREADGLAVETMADVAERVR